MLEGIRLFDELGLALDGLHQSSQTPVTARRPWLRAWVDSYPDTDPVAVVVESDNGDVEGAALFAVRRRAGVRIVTAIGDGTSDLVALPALAHAEDRLAGAVAQWLQQDGPWVMNLRHLSAPGHVASLLSNLLPSSRLLPGDVSPTLRAIQGSSLRAYVSKRHLAATRLRQNRMKRDGLRPLVSHIHAPGAELDRTMVEVESVFRSRDAALGRRCALDQPQFREFFHRVVTVHAELRQVCLTTLRLDGELAAYVLCFVDTDSQRMWNCRFQPKWARYSPGRVAMDAAVSHALDVGSTAFDFMRGEEQYKASYANAHPKTWDFHAWSNAVLAAGGLAYLNGRATVRDLETTGTRAQLVDAARKLKARLG